MNRNDSRAVQASPLAGAGDAGPMNVRRSFGSPHFNFLLSEEQLSETDIDLQPDFSEKLNKNQINQINDRTYKISQFKVENGQDPRFADVKDEIHEERKLKARKK